MKLRTKVTLITAASTLVPLLLVGVTGRIFFLHRAKLEHQKDLIRISDSVKAQFQSWKEEVVTQVEQLALATDPFMSNLIIAAARGGLQPTTARRLAILGPETMRARGLELMTVVGEKNRLWVVGHFPGMTGHISHKVPSNMLAMTRISEDRLMVDGLPVSQLALQVWRTVRVPHGSALKLMGGALVERWFREKLRLPIYVEASLSDQRGEVIYQTANWPELSDASARTALDLGHGDGSVTLTFNLAISERPLQDTLRTINWLLAGVALIALCLSLLLGLLSQRVTRPLEELVSSVRGVGAGDLEVVLEPGAEDEIGDLVRAFNEMAARLKASRLRLAVAERAAAWRDIARVVAHEVRNPLSPIQTSVENIRNAYRKGHPEFTEILDESADAVIAEVNRLKQMVDEFSRFARLPKPKKEKCDICALSKRAVQHYRSGQGSAGSPVGLELPKNTSDSILIVDGDPDQLAQVLVNLIANAEKAVASRPSPQIVISISCQNSDVTICVRDNGEGFTDEFAKRMFDPYVTSHEAEGGTGLGLAIVQRIVLDHGGTIDGQYTKGAGTTFTINLPRSIVDET